MSKTNKKADIATEIAVAGVLTTLSMEELIAIAASPDICREYQQKFPGNFYSTLILSLTHESFSEPQAQALWKALNEHRKSLNVCLKRDVGIAVAAMDYMTNIREVLSEPKIIEEEKIEEISEIATYDKLTGLFTRDVFDAMLEKSFNETRRYNSALSLAMIDIDDFKMVNDSYGHQAGDEVLSFLGRTINRSTRKMDIAARYGGEEFSIIMPKTDLHKAYNVIERIRKQVEKVSVNDIKVTISAGVGQNNADMPSAEKFVQAADEALYKAKQSGKNRVIKV